MVILKQSEKQHLTKEGEVVDRICYDYYGRVDGVTEAVYVRNIEILRDYGPILPGGLLLVLPVITAASPGVRLWNYRPEQVFVPSTAPAERGETDSLLAEFQARRFWDSGRLTEEQIRDLVDEEREERLEIEEVLARRLAEAEATLTSVVEQLSQEVDNRQDSIGALVDHFSEFSIHYGQLLADLAQQISAQGQQLQGMVEAGGSAQAYEEFIVEGEGPVEFTLSNQPKVAKMVFLNGILQPPDFSIVTEDNKLSIEEGSVSDIVVGDKVGVFYFY